MSNKKSDNPTRLLDSAHDLFDRLYGKGPSERDRSYSSRWFEPLGAEECKLLGYDSVVDRLYELDESRYLDSPELQFVTVQGSPGDVHGDNESGFFGTRQNVDSVGPRRFFGESHKHTTNAGNNTVAYGSTELSRVKDQSRGTHRELDEEEEEADVSALRNVHDDGDLRDSARIASREAKDSLERADVENEQHESFARSKISHGKAIKDSPSQKSANSPAVDRSTNKPGGDSGRLSSVVGHNDDGRKTDKGEPGSGQITSTQRKPVNPVDHSSRVRREVANEDTQSTANTSTDKSRAAIAVFGGAQGNGFNKAIATSHVQGSMDPSGMKAYRSNRRPVGRLQANPRGSGVPSRYGSQQNDRESMGRNEGSNSADKLSDETIVSDESHKRVFADVNGSFEDDSSVLPSSTASLDRDAGSTTAPIFRTESVGSDSENTSQASKSRTATTGTAPFATTTVTSAQSLSDPRSPPQLSIVSGSYDPRWSSNFESVSHRQQNRPQVGQLPSLPSYEHMHCFLSPTERGSGSHHQWPWQIRSLPRFEEIQLGSSNQFEPVTISGMRRRGETLNGGAPISMYSNSADRQVASALTQVPRNENIVGFATSSGPLPFEYLTPNQRSGGQLGSLSHRSFSPFCRDDNYWDLRQADTRLRTMLFHEGTCVASPTLAATVIGGASSFSWFSYLEKPADRVVDYSTLLRRVQLDFPAAFAVKAAELGLKLGTNMVLELAQELLKLIGFAATGAGVAAIIAFSGGTVVLPAAIIGAEIGGALGFAYLSAIGIWETIKHLPELVAWFVDVASDSMTSISRAIKDVWDAAGKSNTHREMTVVRSAETLTQAFAEFTAFGALVGGIALLSRKQIPEAIQRLRRLPKTKWTSSIQNELNVQTIPQPRRTRTIQHSRGDVPRQNVDGANHWVIRREVSERPRKRKNFENTIEGLEGYERAHLWGREMGVESGEGILLATKKLNGIHSRLANRLQEIRKLGLKVEVEAKAVQHLPQNVPANLRELKFAAEYQYRIAVTDGSGISRHATVGISIDPPPRSGFQYHVEHIDPELLSLFEGIRPSYGDYR